MKKPTIQKRTLALAAVLIPLAALFAVVVMRSGPLAPVSVVLGTVESRTLSPELFGIGNIEARYTYPIGPTTPGRLIRLDVHVGDRVRAGQAVGEMDPVDLDDRIRAQDAAIQRAKAIIIEANARSDHAIEQADRYERLLQAQSTSEEILADKRREKRITEAALAAAREDLSRIQFERNALIAQRKHLSLVAPVDGLVVSRDVDPGTTVVAGQPVVVLVDPNSLWIHVRFDQIRSHGLTAGLISRITLRSQPGETLPGRILRVEPLADVITEETLAKVVFDRIPTPLPPIGELVEVTIELPPLPPGPVIRNASVQRVQGRTGVWQFIDGSLRFTAIDLGASDLHGRVQVTKGIQEGDRIVLYSEKALTPNRRIRVVDQLSGGKP